MKSRRNLLLLLGGLAVSCGALLYLLYVSESIWLHGQEEGSFPYVETRLPFASATARPALAIYLHGAGPRRASKLKARTLLIAFFSRAHLDATVIAPSCPACRGWPMSDMASFIDEIREQHGDSSPVYVLGFSMGAFAIWRMAEEMPHLISAGVPVAGGAFAPGQHCSPVPIWAVHGMEDTHIPPGASEGMVRDYQACGANARLSLLPGVGHKFRTHTLWRLGVFEWLRDQ